MDSNGMRLDDALEVLLAHFQQGVDALNSLIEALYTADESAEETN